jgi:hypothetical protein
MQYPFVVSVPDGFAYGANCGCQAPDNRILPWPSGCEASDNKVLSYSQYGHEKKARHCWRATWCETWAGYG